MFIGRICTVARTQIGSKFLQQLIAPRGSLSSVDGEGTFEEIIEMCVSEVYKEVAVLITDMFGNYFVQGLFTVSNDDQKTTLLLSLQHDVPRVSCDKVGTYALQNIIGGLVAESHARIVADGLNPRVQEVIFDNHGTHVIQRCQQSFTLDNLDFIFSALTTNCVKIATHQHGIVVLRNCLERCSFENQKELAAIITSNAVLLAKNAFGNYAVQHVLRGVVGDEAAGAVFDKLRGMFVELSQLKFSSNVVERCLQFTGDRRNKLLAELFDAPALETLLGDIYGNYVIQTALKGANIEERKHFATLIRPLLSILKKDGPSVYRYNTTFHY